MPNPISSNTDPTFSPEISNEENEALMSLVSAHPSDPNQSSAASPTQPAPATPSPAVSTLVSRFTPSGSHPPPETSILSAFANCKLATVSYVGTLGSIAAAAPETFGASVAFGLVRIGAASATLLGCLEEEEAKQVVNAERADAIADCNSAGAAALTAADGSVICVK
ncbi:MAG TPA: hypothetical protein VHV51_15190 [Polyangiaceae bacterium]|jgi:hypothetical protein|nr:hypothetical protein [Polyangiaceae bacterium]